jgi:hypothetical protein
VEAEPSNVEIPTFDAFVRHDYRVQILDVHVGSSLVGPTSAELGYALSSEASRNIPEWRVRRGRAPRA